MVKLKKYGWYILAAVVIIAGALYALWYYRNKNVSLDFTVGGSIVSILQDIQGRYIQPESQRGIGVYLDVPMTTIVNNKGTSATVLKNLGGSISYNGEPILQTKTASTALANVKVPGKSSVPVTDDVQVLINAETIKFFTELLKGNKPVAKYDFTTTLFGVPYALTNQTTINKS